MLRSFFPNDMNRSKTKDRRTHSCISCGLYKDVLSPKMRPFGKGKRGILNIGEAPGETEDKRNKQWQGRVGTRLKQTYAKFGIDLFEDCVNINSVNCRPPGNRTPSDYEVACCRKNILNTIKEYEPKIIILLGNTAINSLIGHRWKKDLGGVSKWRGWAIPDRDFNAWVCPIFHPSYIERSNREEIITIWENDIKQISQHINKPLPKYEDDIQYIKILKSKSEIRLFLRNLMRFPPKFIAIDYETTGLKPHSKGHRIICCAIATGAGNSFVFEVPDKGRWFSGLFERVLTSKIKKVAANIKFEHAWTKAKYDFDIHPWHWDTMINAHIINNRPGITGLKFQTYVNFGVIDYDSEISTYLQPTSKDKKELGANAFNQIHKCLESPHSKEQLLIYCGLDALYEYRLMLLQKEKIYETI